jgi:bacillithiol synthase
MIVKKIAFDTVSAFSLRDITYQNTPAVFHDFYAFNPDINGLKMAIEERKKYAVDRLILQTEIRKQYEGQILSPLQEKNIDAIIDANSLTVVTAHQPVLFGGPMYYIYKIISVINLADKLTESTPHKIIPVFINGSEDHDFEEVNHFTIFGKKMSWAHFQGGPVGRYKTEGLSEIVDAVAAVLGNNPHAEKITRILNASLYKVANYNGFVFNFINALFKEWGLLVLNMDNPAFKSVFAPIMEEELLRRPSADLIRQAQSKLHDLGFGEQAYAREINLFYMKDGLRERIIQEGEHYSINNTEIKFSESSILDELKHHPENFSPNVIMRPLYEEAILPNIAYIGGGGELAYWLERKEQFKFFNVFFPCLIRRNSALIISKSQAQTLAKFNLSVDDLFLKEDRLIDKYLTANTALELNADAEVNHIETAFDSLKVKASTADKTLEAFVEGEKNKALKQIEQIESRIKRSHKKNEETAINQLKNIQQKLFPQNGLQERSDNFIQYYNNTGYDILKVLKKELDPLHKEFVIIVED